MFISNGLWVLGLNSSSMIKAGDHVIEKLTTYIHKLLYVLKIELNLCLFSVYISCSCSILQPKISQLNNIVVNNFIIIHLSVKNNEVKLNSLDMFK